MEFVEGGTLHDRIQTSPEMSEATVQHIIRQVLYALEYMHERHQVSHRDLKPAVRFSFFLLIDIIEHPSLRSRVVSHYQDCRSRTRED